MLREADVETLATILSEARWLAGSGEPRDRIELWTRRSLHERLSHLALTTGRALLARAANAARQIQEPATSPAPPRRRSYRRS